MPILKPVVWLNHSLITIRLDLVHYLIINFTTIWAVNSILLKYFDLLVK